MSSSRVNNLNHGYGNNTRQQPYSSPYSQPSQWDRPSAINHENPSSNSKLLEQQ